MDGSVNEEQVTGLGLRPKRLKTCEINKDFINDLPDSILVHILSYLPLKDAIKTVLLRRFGKLWLSMPVLDLDNCANLDYGDSDDLECFDYANFIDIIRQVWHHNDIRTLDKLRVKFPFARTNSEDKVAFDDHDIENHKKREKEKKKAIADEIEKLVCYAISRKVKVMDLNFKGCDILLPPLHQFFKLPGIFRSDYLTDLRLAACDITSWAKVTLRSLRVLFLQEVSLSDKVMEKIVHGCPFLEELFIVDCFGLVKLTCESPNLKKLKLCVRAGGRRIFLSCPYLVSLELTGWIERATLLNVSSVVDASIYFGYSFKCQKKRYVSISSLLLNLHQCKTFTPCTWSILVLSIWKFEDLPSPHFKWKNIVLRLSLTKWHLPGLSFLFKGSVSLETLSVYISPGWDHLFQQKQAKWIWEYDFDADNYWDSQKATLPCLESITIYGHITDPYVIQMVKFLLKNAPILQKMVISTKKDMVPFFTEGQNDTFTSEQLTELSQKLLTFPRASSQAMVYFS